MTRRTYVIGVDFDSQCRRAVLVDTANGREIAPAVQPYAYGVIDEMPPGASIRWEPDLTLQDAIGHMELR